MLWLRSPAEQGAKWLKIKKKAYIFKSDFYKKLKLFERYVEAQRIDQSFQGTSKYLFRLKISPEEFSKVMQILDCVSVFPNCLQFSQPPLARQEWKPPTT